MESSAPQQEQQSQMGLPDWEVPVGQSQQQEWDQEVKQLINLYLIDDEVAQPPIPTLIYKSSCPPLCPVCTTTGAHVFLPEMGDPEFQCVEKIIKGESQYTYPNEVKGEEVSDEVVDDLLDALKDIDGELDIEIPFQSDESMDTGEWDSAMASVLLDSIDESRSTGDW